jgi:ribosome-associated protein
VALRDLCVSPRRLVPARFLSFRSVRASGPGGQHVNKVATRVVLTLDLDGASGVLGGDAVRRIRHRLASRIDAAGDLTITCGRTRSLARNLELAHVRLEELIGEALVRHRTRRPTRPTAASTRRRVDDKRRRSATKARRQRPADD